MKVEWNELPQGSHCDSEEVRRVSTRKARMIVKRPGSMGNNGSDHVSIGHMSARTLHVVTHALISKIPADSSRLFIFR